MRARSAISWCILLACAAWLLPISMALGNEGPPKIKSTRDVVVSDHNPATGLTVPRTVKVDVKRKYKQREEARNSVKTRALEEFAKLDEYDPATTKFEILFASAAVQGQKNEETRLAPKEWAEMCRYVALFYEDAGKWDDAMDFYERALVADPTASWAKVGRAHMHTKYEDFQAAWIEFVAVAEDEKLTEEERSAAFYGMALIIAGGDKKIAYLSKALTFDLENHLAWTGMGYEQTAQEKPGATDSFRNSLIIYETAEAHFQIARLLAIEAHPGDDNDDSANDEEEIDADDIANTADAQQDPASDANESGTEVEERDWIFDKPESSTEKGEAAVWHYERSIAMDPNSPSGYQNLGNLFLFREQPNEARAVLLKGVERVKSARLHAGLASVAQFEGDGDAAIEHYKQAIHIDPTVAMIHYGLSLEYQKKGWTDKALKRIKRAAKLSPDEYGDIYAEFEGAVMEQTAIPRDENDAVAESEDAADVKAVSNEEAKIDVDTSDEAADTPDDSVTDEMFKSFEELDKLVGGLKDEEDWDLLLEKTKQLLNGLPQSDENQELTDELDEIMEMLRQGQEDEVLERMTVLPESEQKTPHEEL